MRGGKGPSLIDYYRFFLGIARESEAKIRLRVPIDE
jgi:hypothetical protein